MTELATKACSHNWRTYWARFQGSDKKLDSMVCTKCDRVLTAEYIVKILSYVLHDENLKKLDEEISNE